MSGRWYTPRRPRKPPAMDKPIPCRHTRTQLIAKDNESEYVECLDCRAILEAGEIADPTGFNESLADA